MSLWENHSVTTNGIVQYYFVSVFHWKKWSRLIINSFTRSTYMFLIQVPSPSWQFCWRDLNECLCNSVAVTWPQSRAEAAVNKASHWDLTALRRDSVKAYWLETHFGRGLNSRELWGVAGRHVALAIQKLLCRRWKSARTEWVYQHCMFLVHNGRK